MDWIPVIGFENEYELNRNGEVRRKETRNILKFAVGKVGYPLVSLWKNNKGKSKYIHKLLASHFIPNPNNYPTVNHKDGNKTNFDLLNLEWASYSQNNQHAYDSGLKITSERTVNAVRERAKTRNKGNNFRSLPLEVYDLEGNLIKEYISIKAACKDLAVHRSGIFRYLRGQIASPKHYKYKSKEA